MSKDLTLRSLPPKNEPSTIGEDLPRHFDLCYIFCWIFRLYNMVITSSNTRFPVVFLALFIYSLKSSQAAGWHNLWGYRGSPFPASRALCHPVRRSAVLQTSRENYQLQLQWFTSRETIREGFKKSKWKFKMAFAMKGGGSRGGLECHIPILKNDFC